MSILYAVGVSGGYTSFTFDIYRPSESPEYLITNIEGLGPDIGVQSFQDYACLPGSVNTMTRYDKRVITFTIAIPTTTAVEDSRNKLYKIFPLNRNVKIKFYYNKGRSTDQRRYINGMVTKITPVIFTSLEYFTVEVTCPYPFFADVDKVTITKTNQGPYSNPSDCVWTQKVNGDVGGPFILQIKQTALGGKSKQGLPKFRIFTRRFDDSTTDGQTTGYMYLDMANMSECLKVSAKNYPTTAALTHMKVGHYITVNTTPGSRLVTYTTSEGTFDITGCVTQVGTTGTTTATTSTELPAWAPTKTSIHCAPFLDNNAGDKWTYTWYQQGYWLGA